MTEICGMRIALDMGPISALHVLLDHSPVVWGEEVAMDGFPRLDVQECAPVVPVDRAGIVVLTDRCPDRIGAGLQPHCWRGELDRAPSWRERQFATGQRGAVLTMEHAAVP